jgi:hypothetical protein
MSPSIHCHVAILVLAVASAGAVCGPLGAQNLIPNSGFESGTGVVCSPSPNGPQGLLPSPWIQAGFLGSAGGTDTHSADCAILPGLDSTWGNYTPFVAHCGVRWAAATNAPVIHEAMAVQLTGPLTIGRTYLLAGFFMRSSRANHTLATGYDCFLSENGSILVPGNSVQVAIGLGAGSPASTWTESSTMFTWQPGLATTPYLVLEAAGTAGIESSYMGVDDLVLAEFGTFYSYPQRTSTAPLLSSNGQVAPGLGFTVDLTAAPPQEACVWLLGVEQRCRPLFGQLLVVEPVTCIPAMTTTSGTGSQAFTWPNGVPPGSRVFFQTWVRASPTTVVATNGLAAVGG